MKRRLFLKTLFSAGGVSVLGSLGYAFVKYLVPPQTGTGPRQVAIRKDEVPEGGAREFVFGDTPAVVINLPGAGYIALSRVCTHLGCLVDYQADQGRLFCPCHAGVYDLDGRVVSGPPPKPLERFPLRVEREDIIVG
ncbi:MAG: Rieske (2Fe-2S) protein [Nitrospirota bacterium]|jgi:cytochrome b6-f complex iron-sulfur subunit